MQPEVIVSLLGVNEISLALKQKKEYGRTAPGRKARKHTSGANFLK